MKPFRQTGGLGIDSFHINDLCSIRPAMAPGN